MSTAADAACLLIEIGTEELPPLGLPTLSAALTAGIVKGLTELGIAHGAVRSFATPRRLAVSIEACAERAADRSIERRGPPAANAFDASGAPSGAAIAFAKSCGVEVAALSRLTTDKGSWLSFRGTERGAETRASIAAILARAIADLPIAKRMRWGAGTAEFVRPVHWIVLLFGREIVPAEILGLNSDRITHGHRFHAPEPIVLENAESYESALAAAKVVADFARRRESIRTSSIALAAESGRRALIEPELLDEVTALVEWPVPIMGGFEARFLTLPREVVIATVQDHQRYFPLEELDGRLANRFITVSNLESRDPAKVREGNERVVRPRLSDAAFFWDQDCKLKLEAHAAKLAGVTFQAKLGNYADKTRRVAALAEAIGVQWGIGAGASAGAGAGAGAGGAALARAAVLSKADLMTAMVGEFPELQGTMGRYYAAAEGEPDEVSRALEEQYRPRFAGDALPATKTGRALSVADKIDTLVGIFAIEQRPTGTKDPFGLRRAALGVLRILIEAAIDLDLGAMLEISAAAQPVQRPGTAAEVYSFMVERLRGLLLERADRTTPEMIDAVLAVGRRSPYDIELRLQALKGFLQLPDAAILAAANKRIANILKKSAVEDSVRVDATLFVEPAERALYADLQERSGPVLAAIADRRYAESLQLLASFRASIDGFFAAVMVMDENPARRDNRLALLAAVRKLFSGVADLSRLPG
jgi:glycyl-tRNA synthetase beta chain